MAYYAEKPATVIATNGMFILDEHVDLKSIQIGGTIGSIYSFSDEERFNSYLYIKGMDSKGEIAYLKITIGMSEKVILLPEMSVMTLNKDGKVICKSADYHVCMVQNDEFVNYASICEKDDSFLTSFYFDDINNIQYPNVEELLSSIQGRHLYQYRAKIVKQPELHPLYSAVVED